VEKTRKRKKKKKNLYFTQDTENSIIEYNNTEDMNVRNRIYEDNIKHAFEKLAENILNTFKFSYFECSHEEVQMEVVSNLVSNMHKFKEGKGKAFSYFSIIAKNFLILYNNGNYKKFKRHTSVDDEEIVYEHKELTYFPKETTRKKELSEFMKLMVEYWDEHINIIFKRKSDKEIAAAVVEVFRRSESIENFNKKAIYLYIREMTNCKTQAITKVIGKMKKTQSEIYNEYRDTGRITMN
tara:strand:+ start:677 stop:1393 length:717 start_codon:yes stop_codon:yes gene_type:complete